MITIMHAEQALLPLAVPWAGVGSSPIDDGPVRLTRDVAGGSYSAAYVEYHPRLDRGPNLALPWEWWTRAGGGWETSRARACDAADAALRAIGWGLA